MENIIKVKQKYFTEQSGPENPVEHWHEKPLAELSGTHVPELLQGLLAAHFDILNNVEKSAKRKIN